MNEKTETKKAIKELTLLLMYLNRFTDEKDFKTAKDFYTWKGYSFNIMVVCQIVLIKKFRLTINRTKRIFLRIKS